VRLSLGEVAYLEDRLECSSDCRPSFARAYRYPLANASTLRDCGSDLNTHLLVYENYLVALIQTIFVSKGCTLANTILSFANVIEVCIKFGFGK
jgi:hypothetical protein